MSDTCVCYLPLTERHCTSCHTTFETDPAYDDHLSVGSESTLQITRQQCEVPQCPTCETAWWLSHSPGAPAPLPGTWCVCVGCGDTAIFTGRGLEVRAPDPDENQKIGRDSFILDYREQRELVRRTT